MLQYINTSKVQERRERKMEKKIEKLISKIQLVFQDESVSSKTFTERSYSKATPTCPGSPRTLGCLLYPSVFWIC